jgi:hypothetical protein
MIEKALFRLPVLLAVATLCQLVLVWLATSRYGQGTPMGDLLFAYKPWADNVLKYGQLLGIASPWVYPFPALVPIVGASILSPTNYELGWLVLRLVVTLVVTTMLVLYRRDAQAPSRRARYLAGYAWVGFTFALGPVSISRIDSWSVALAVLGALALTLQSQRFAAAAFTFAAWIKIWPVALFAPLLFDRNKIWSTLRVGAGVSALLLIVGLLLGGNASLLSFISGQTDRGIQIESPAAMPWVWAGALGASDAGITYNAPLMTFEVFGANSDWVAWWLGPVQLGAIAITFVLGWLATRRGVSRASEVITWTALTGTCDLIFFNKVGSPQFISWLAVPIILGVLYGVERWRLASVLVLALSLTTWLVYPMLYDDLVWGGWAGTAVLTVRNLLELALLVYANVRLTALANQKTAVDTAS